MAVCLLTIAFAGCIGDGNDADGALEKELAPKYPVSGIVLNGAFRPVEGANATLLVPSAVYLDGTRSDDLVPVSATTDTNGAFELQSFPGTHTLTVTHADHASYTMSVEVAGPVEVAVTLQPKEGATDVPFAESFDFDGRVECALEAFIITPSCDTILTFRAETQDMTVFETNSEFLLTTQPGWQTVVLDVFFDGSTHPGIEGLRASSYAADGTAEVLTYERINQRWASGDFSLRVDAGVDYGDNVPAPGSEGGDDMLFRFFPQGYGDDTLCIPENAPETDPRIAPGTCFLGAGFSQDVTFTATATIFVHEPAPDGWTTLGNA